MAVAPFDALKYVKSLRAVGVSQEQAEVHSETLSDALQTNLKDLATKDDLKAQFDSMRFEMKAMFDQQRAEMKNQADQFRFELKSQVELLRAEMKNLGDQLRHEIQQGDEKLTSKIDILRWITGVGVLGVLTVLVRTFLFRAGP